ncbi:putative protoporphyrinogen oxidase hemJ [Candidatus Kinetoplastibacterium desouzaii TCC079E]|uniref:Protoporphyrinogen IX oxidase n=2 Tax=Candidatus Kinetoplastidibacterium desouzai TaxID=994692 RepID=M1LS72_9PROT|nr:CopD family protein [Candidatus Kinetoplastibacterium desouzaii]AEM25252.1 putative protoporphyrinogen oxidase [Candidatus Kinetoplastibacterium desouzaii]AGF46991.1 putative protoporphyrinogen oxidase hemJ [Candidatus Kinetoplastibacterium desouzaii TCC079E]
MKIFVITHMVIAISWFAGIFYLPRIYVNIAQQNDTHIKNILIGMAQRLLNFMRILSIGTLFSGIAIYLSHDKNIDDLNHNWIYIKLIAVFLLFIYQSICSQMLLKFEKNTNVKSHNFYRVFNEIPLILLIIIVSMVILKPF